MRYPDTCPNCKASLRGEEIPEHRREHYRRDTHYTRVIGLSSMERDCLIAWLCPDCEHKWPVEGREQWFSEAG